MVKTLRDKLLKINDAVTMYDEEGFNHLAQFEKKLLKKRAKLYGNKEKSEKSKK